MGSGFPSENGLFGVNAAAPGPVVDNGRRKAPVRVGMVTGWGALVDNPGGKGSALCALGSAPVFKGATSCALVSILAFKAPANARLVAGAVGMGAARCVNAGARVALGANADLMVPAADLVVAANVQVVGVPMHAAGRRMIAGARRRVADIVTGSCDGSVHILA